MRRTRATALVVAGLGLVGGSLVAAPGVAVADEEPLVFSSFDDAELDTTGWSLLGDACFTSADSSSQVGCDPELGGPAADEDEGYLQLSGAAYEQVGGAYSATTVPSDQAFEITFDQYQYGGGETGNEGIVLYLGVPLEVSTTLGSPGAGLGYSPSFPPPIELRRSRQTANPFQTTPGLSGAYVGVGLDASGLFATDEADGKGCTPSDEQPAPDSVTVRGPSTQPTSEGEGPNQSGYCHIGTTSLSTVPGLQGTSLRAGDIPGSERAVRVTVEPRVEAGPTITVEIDPDGVDGDAGMVEVGSYDVAEPPPSDYRVGFTAATTDWLPVRRAVTRARVGGGPDVHLVDDVRISTLDDDPDPASIPTTTRIKVTSAGMTAKVFPPARVDPPTGRVVFSADGQELDRVRLRTVRGVATAVSDVTVPPGEDVDFTAEYLGQGLYEPSDDLYERVDPVIRARIVTDEVPNAAGWYDETLVIRFRCTEGSAPIVGGCPKRVFRQNTHPRRVFTKSIRAKDGGGDTVKVPIKVDHRGPVIEVFRAKGSPYPRDARPIRCTAYDGRSGVKRDCWVEYGEFERLASGRVRRHFTVRASDVAGNISVRRLRFWIQRERD